MGIVNVTPDSFSDGGRYLDAGRRRRPRPRAGGGRCRRPRRRRRVDPTRAPSRSRPPRSSAGCCPSCGGSPREAGVPVSVDTTKAVVAAAALDAGATIVNDVSAGRADPDMLGVVADAGAGLRRDAHARATRARCSTTRATTTSSPRSATSSSPGSTPRARRASTARRSSRTPGIGFGKTVGAQPRRCSPRSPSWSAARRRPGARRPVAQGLHGAVLGGDDPLERATTATLATVGLVRRPRRARSCGCTTCAAARAPRCSGCSTSCDGGVEARERSLGAGARTAGLLLDHQGPARGVRAARRVRPQPPQGAAPGGADLAHRTRLHPRAVAARLAAQPPRVRRGRHRRTRTCRSAVTTSWPERLHRDLRDARARGSTIPTSRCSSTTRSSAIGCIGRARRVPRSTRASSPRARTRSWSSRRSPGASSGRRRARSSRSRVDEGIVRGIARRHGWPGRASRPALSDGTDRHQGSARARRARRAPRGADATAAVRGRRRARPSTSTRGGRDRRARRHRRLRARSPRRSAGS